MNDNGPLVSVVVPSYNRPAALLDSLTSIERQTYSNVEVVVVDDASERAVNEVVDENSFSYPITVIRHEENRGASTARNTGIDRSNGEFVAFLDDDDIWEPRKIEKQIDRLREASDDVGVVYTGMRFVSEDGNSLRTHVEKVEGDVTKELLKRNLVGSFSTVMVRSEAIDDIGTLDQQFPCWQDIEWYIRLSIHWKFVSVPEPLVRMRQHGGEHISDDFDTIRNTALSLFVEKYRPLARSYGWRFEREFFGWIEFRIGAYNALRTGHYAAARYHLFRAVKWYPLEWQFWMFFFVSLGGKPVYNFLKRVVK